MPCSSLAASHFFKVDWQHYTFEVGQFLVACGGAGTSGALGAGLCLPYSSLAASHLLRAGWQHHTFDVGRMLVCMWLRGCNDDDILCFCELCNGQLATKEHRDRKEKN
jgi:hypothetical protein